MNQPLVTVITGFYNRGHLLQRTLDSLLNQTYSNIEIIVFDDCSKDDTHERLDWYRKLGDPRLVIIEHERNLGFTQGMVNAISISRGKYIAVQGSGDVSMPGRIEKQVKVLEEQPEVCVVGSFYQNIVEDSDIVRPRRIVADNASLTSLLRGNVFSHGEVMMRKDAYNEVGGYRCEFRYAQDIDLWLRMITKGNFFTVKEVLYHRYVQFDGVSYDPKKFLLQARYGIIAGQLARVSGAEHDALYQRLRQEGPEALVAPNHIELQTRIFKACVRASVWGDTCGALNLTKHIQNRILASLLGMFGKSFNNSMFNPFRRVVFKLLGINAT